MYVVSTSGEFVWNEGVVVQLPAPFITMGDLFIIHCTCTEIVLKSYILCVCLVLLFPHKNYQCTVLLQQVKYIAGNKVFGFIF